MTAKNTLSGRTRRRFVTWMAAGLALLSGGTAGAAPAPEPWRPQFHFTPPRNWMNDPNGMVYHDGEYHLFYQYNPFGDKWGHMSWGHAVSRDLVRWRDLPVALPEAGGIMIFSGSAVVDSRNTSGFGTKGRAPLVAIYTGHREGRQDQRLAYSNDRGRTWTQYAGNPVLDLGLADFRDPKVFWHPPSSRWIMTVALSTEHKVRFYVSPNLREWELAGEFGPRGATNGLWECPDLFPVRVEGGGQRWVLIVNINPGGPAGGSGCQYFTGDFDGKQFRADPFPATGGSEARWADYGSDFYAGVTWSGIPDDDGRRIWLGWMSNWQYAQDVPTSPWRSAMTVPRELVLRRAGDGLRLAQRPVRELASLRGRRHRFRGGDLAAASAWLAGLSGLGNLTEVQLEITGVRDAETLGLRLVTGPREATVVRAEPRRGRLAVDRTAAGRSDFHGAFAAVHEAPLSVDDGRLRLRLLVDTGSVEVFAGDGDVVLTDLIFPGPGPRRWELFGTGPRSMTAIRVQELTVWELRGAAVRRGGR